jgi:hypothetical protein
MEFEAPPSRTRSSAAKRGAPLVLSIGGKPNKKPKAAPISAKIKAEITKFEKWLEAFYEGLAVAGLSDKQETLFTAARATVWMTTVPAVRGQAAVIMAKLSDLATPGEPEPQDTPLPADVMAEVDAFEAWTRAFRDGLLVRGLTGAQEALFTAAKATVWKTTFPTVKAQIFALTSKLTADVAEAGTDSPVVYPFQVDGASAFLNKRDNFVATLKGLGVPEHRFRALVTPIVWKDPKRFPSQIAALETDLSATMTAIYDAHGGSSLPPCTFCSLTVSSKGATLCDDCITNKAELDKTEIDRIAFNEWRAQRDALARDALAKAALEAAAKTAQEKEERERAKNPHPPGLNSSGPGVCSTCSLSALARNEFHMCTRCVEAGASKASGIISRASSSTLSSLLSASHLKCMPLGIPLSAFTPAAIGFWRGLNESACTSVFEGKPAALAEFRSAGAGEVASLVAKQSKNNNIFVSANGDLVLNQPSVFKSSEITGEADAQQRYTNLSRMEINFRSPGRRDTDNFIFVGWITSYGWKQAVALCNEIRTTRLLAGTYDVIGFDAHNDFLIEAALHNATRAPSSPPTQAGNGSNSNKNGGKGGGGGGRDNNRSGGGGGSGRDNNRSGGGGGGGRDNNRSGGGGGGGRDNNRSGEGGNGGGNGGNKASGYRDFSLMPRPMIKKCLGGTACLDFNLGICQCDVDSKGYHDYKGKNDVVKHIQHVCVECGATAHGWVNGDHG